MVDLLTTLTTRVLGVGVGTVQPLITSMFTPRAEIASASLLGLDASAGRSLPSRAPTGIAPLEAVNIETVSSSLQEWRSSEPVAEIELAPLVLADYKDRGLWRLPRHRVTESTRTSHLISNDPDVEIKRHPQNIEPSDWETPTEIAATNSELGEAQPLSVTMPLLPSRAPSNPGTPVAANNPVARESQASSIAKPSVQAGDAVVQSMETGGQSLDVELWDVPVEVSPTLAAQESPVTQDAFARSPVEQNTPELQVVLPPSGDDSATVPTEPALQDQALQNLSVQPSQTDEWTDSPSVVSKQQPRNRTFVVSTQDSSETAAQVSGTVNAEGDSSATDRVKPTTAQRLTRHKDQGKSPVDSTSLRLEPGLQPLVELSDRSPQPSDPLAGQLDHPLAEQPLKAQGLIERAIARVFDRDQRDNMVVQPILSPVSPSQAVQPALPSAELRGTLGPISRSTELSRRDSLIPPPVPPTPTIQVTIGRLEVRVSRPQPPSVPPAKSRRPGPALSLSDYLEQRQRGEI
jgi:hypothetical protein